MDLQQWALWATMNTMNNNEVSTFYVSFVSKAVVLWRPYILLEYILILDTKDLLKTNDAFYATLITQSESECCIQCVNFKCRNIWTVLEIILKYWWYISKLGGVFGGTCKILEVLGFLLVYIYTFVKAYFMAKQCVNMKCFNMNALLIPLYNVMWSFT